MPCQDVASDVWPRSAASAARRNTTIERGGDEPVGLREWDTVSGERASAEVVGRLGEDTARQVLDAGSALRARSVEDVGNMTRMRGCLGLTMDI
jgi:hypothetical protein